MPDFNFGSITDTQKRQQMLRDAGLDPTQFDFDASGGVIRAKPQQSPVTQDSPSLKPTTEPTPLGSFGRQAAAGVLPAGAGLLAGSLAAAAAAPFTGGGSLIPLGVGLAGALSGSYLASKGQEALLPDEAKQALARDVEVNPKASLAGNLAGSLAFLKPDFKSVGSAAQGVRNLVTGGAEKLSAAQAGNLLNVGLGGGIGAASSIYDDVSSGHDIDFGKLAISSLGNAIINNPNRLGQKLGAAPNFYDVAGEPQLRDTIAGDTTTLKQEEVMRRAAAERAAAIEKQQQDARLLAGLPAKYKKAVEAGKYSARDAVILANEDAGIAQRKAERAAAKKMEPSVKEDIGSFGKQEQGYEDLYSKYGDFLSQQAAPQQQETPQLKLQRTKESVDNQLAQLQTDLELRRFTAESARIEAEQKRLAEIEQSYREDALAKAKAVEQPTPRQLEYLEPSMVKQQITAKPEVRPVVPTEEATVPPTARQTEADLLMPKTEGEQIQEDYDLGRRRKQEEDNAILNDEQKKIIQDAKAEVAAKAADSNVSLEPTVGFRDAMQQLAEKRGIKLESDPNISGAGETVSVDEQKRLRAALQQVVAKINPNKAGLDTWPHELFHPFITDMETSNSKIAQGLAKKAKEVFGGSEEVLTDLTGKEVVSRLLNLDKEGRTTKFFRDFMSYIKTRYGNPTTADVKRLMANRLLNEVPYSELTGKQLGEVGAKDGSGVDEVANPTEAVRTQSDEQDTVSVVSRIKKSIGEDELRNRAKYLIDELTDEQKASINAGPRTVDALALETAARLTDSGKWDTYVKSENRSQDTISALKEEQSIQDKFKEVKKGAGFTEEEIAKGPKVADKDLKAAKFAGETRVQEESSALPRQQSEEPLSPHAGEGATTAELKPEVAAQNPLKLGVLDFMLGQADKVKKVDQDLGTAFEKFFARRSYLEGKYSNVIQEAVAPYSKETRQRVSDYMMALDAGKPAPYTLKGEEVKLHSEIRDYLTKVRQDQNDLGILVAGVRKGNVTENYFPNMMGRDVVDTLVNKGNSSEAARYRTLWREHIVEASGGKVTPKEANNIINDYVSAIGGRSLSGNVEFGAVRKAEGYGLPPELQEKDLLARMTRYGKRVAKDFAYFQELQNKPEVAAKLGLRDLKGQIIRSEKVERISSEDINKALRMVSDDLDHYHPVTNAFNRVITNSLLGPLSGLRDVVSIPVNVAPYINKLEDFGAFLRVIPKLGKAYKDSLRTNARKENLDTLLFGEFGNSGNYVVDAFNKLATGMRTLQGREFLEQGARTYSYALGEELTRANMARAVTGDKSSLEWLKKFGTIVDSTDFSSAASVRKLTQEDIGKIAKGFVDRVQGSYDGRNLPLGIMEGPAAPFFALSRWSVEKTNVIRKDVLEPLARGNVKPFLTYTLGALLTGAAIDKMAEEINNRRSSDATLNEAFKNSQATTEDKVGYVVKALQLAGYAGILSDTVKGLWDVKSGKVPQGFTYPAADFIAHTLGENLSDAMTAIKEGEDPAKTLGLLTEQVAKNSVQAYRLINNNFINEEDTKRSEKFRDKAVYETMTGIKSPSAAGQARSNPFVDTEYKDFKRADTAEEAIAAFKPAIAAAIRKSGGDAGKLQRELSNLKRNSFQTMPNPENMPQEFLNYVLFLKETQGEEAASERVQEYLKMQQLNKLKSKAVPAS